MAGQLGDDLLPDDRAHLLVDTVVGDHLGVMLGEGNVDEHAGAAAGGVHVLGDELLDGLLVRPGALDRARRDGETERLPLVEGDAGGEDSTGHLVSKMSGSGTARASSADHIRASA
jgi:hypothetical protein